MGRRVERTRNAGTMTEAGYWGWIRSHMRRMSMRWKPYYATLNKNKRHSQNKNKRLKYEYQCDKCKRWFSKKDVCVDHIEPVGSLKCYDDLPEFVEKLLTEDGFQVLCNYKLADVDKFGGKPSCHYTKTQAERPSKR